MQQQAVEEIPALASQELDITPRVLQGYLWETEGEEPIKKKKSQLKVYFQ